MRFGDISYRNILFTMCALSLSGCYYVQAARGQLDVMSKREPIDELVATDATPDDLARRLELVLKARQFAVDELRLPDNDSYRSYADLGRDYVVLCRARVLARTQDLVFPDCRLRGLSGLFLGGGRSPQGCEAE
jgi:predicted aminopeptidase